MAARPAAGGPILPTEGARTRAIAISTRAVAVFRAPAGEQGVTAAPARLALSTCSCLLRTCPSFVHGTLIYQIPWAAPPDLWRRLVQFPCLASINLLCYVIMINCCQNH